MSDDSRAWICLRSGVAALWTGATIVPGCLLADAAVAAAAFPAGFFLVLERRDSTTARTMTAMTATMTPIAMPAVGPLPRELDVDSDTGAADVLGVAAAVGDVDASGEGAGDGLSGTGLGDTAGEADAPVLEDVELSTGVVGDGVVDTAAAVDVRISSGGDTVLSPG